MKIKRFGNIVEHAGSGLRLPEKLARQIEHRAAKLPKDFTYRRLAKNAAELQTDPNERTDISTITTDAVDRDNEVVLPAGGDWSSYNKVVAFAHQYDQLPIGSNWWMKAKGNGIVAKTHYPPRPDDWQGDWLPSAVLHLMQQPVPSCTGKSIGFLPLNIRTPTSDEISRRPELKNVGTIIDRWIGLEYSVAPIPCNSEAEMISVGKSVESGAFGAATADVVRRAMETFTSLSESLMEKNISAQNHLHPAVLAPVPQDHADKLKAMTEKVKVEHLARGGRAKAFHVTIDHNLNTEDAETVKRALAGVHPFDITLGKTSHFPATKSRESDVVKVEAHGSDLDSLHGRLATILPHAVTDVGSYKPHVTLAHVRPGMGKDYDSMTDADGCSMKCVKLIFGTRGGTQTEIPLADASETKTASEAGNAGMNVGGGVVGDPPAREDYDQLPPCPKCMQATAVQKIGDDQYHCETCKTEFTSEQAGGDAYNAEPHKAKAAKSIQANQACVTRALKLVSEGKCDQGSASAPNGGDRQDDDCLAFDTSKPEGSAGRRKYPIIIGGSVKSHLVQNAEARATQNGAGAVAKAARRIMAAIQGREKALANLPRIISAEKVEAERCELLKKELSATIRKEVETFMVLETGFKRL